MKRGPKYETIGELEPESQQKRVRVVEPMALERQSIMKPNYQKDFPHLKAVDRIARIPVFETGYHFATDLYNKIKKSNGLVTWSLNSAEAGVMLAFEITLPAVLLLEAPLHTVDNILCRSLDIVEERVPAINYPPELIYNKTKDYVSTKVVQPVLNRADSVKQISLHNASKYGEMAATRLDNALDVADKYVDKYLPDVGDNPSDTTDSATEVQAGSKTAQTIDHVNRLSRKLKRRLTHRTIAEARALKRQSADTLQCLIYLADLLAKDPKAFMEKARKMWEHLSEDEPENQVPPANLEQLIAMLTREVARRVVHLVNYTGATVSRLPQRAGNTIHIAAHNINSLADYVLKKVHLESMKVTAVAEAKFLFVRAQEVLTQVKILGINLLERILSQLTSATHHIQTSYPMKQITAPQKPHTPENVAPTPSTPSPKNSSPPSQAQNSNNEQSNQKTPKSNSTPKEKNQEQNNSTPQKKKEKDQEKEKAHNKEVHIPEDTAN